MVLCAFKYVSKLWRSRQLQDVKLLSIVRCWEYTATRPLVYSIQPSPDLRVKNGIPVLFSGWLTGTFTSSFLPPFLLRENHGPKSVNSSFARSFSPRASDKPGQNRSETKKDISSVDDPFNSPTYDIPEKPVTFVEGASYSVIILVGLGIAAAAGYGVFRSLYLSPKSARSMARLSKEFKMTVMQAKFCFHTRLTEQIEKCKRKWLCIEEVRVRIGSPLTGYGPESRNRAARQQIPNRIWMDEDGVEHVEVNFYIRGPHGHGKVFSEMFKDQEDKQWKFTYLLVDVKSPSSAQLMLESYIPAYNVNKCFAAFLKHLAFVDGLEIERKKDI